MAEYRHMSTSTAQEDQVTNSLHVAVVTTIPYEKHNIGMFITIAYRVLHPPGLVSKAAKANCNNLTTFKSTN